MAEGILKLVVAKQADTSKWQIDSAGTWAHDGSPPAVLSQIVVFGMGGDISSHESMPVTTELIKHYDLILTMERKQKEGLILLYPDHAERIFMLSEMVGRIEDISDPILGDMADYQACAKQMEYYLTDGFPKIQMLADKLAVKKSK